MADRGITFSAPMICALVEGRKTQTRRLVNPQPADGVTSAGVIARSGEGQTDEWTWLSGDPEDFDSWTCEGDFKTGFRPGDRLYVRERYFQRGHWEAVPGRQTKGGRQKWAFVPADDVVQFDAPESFRKGRHHADPGTVAWHQRLARFMPRAASRLTLIVETVRVEPLLDISEADAAAEGFREGKLDDGFGPRDFGDGVTIESPGTWASAAGMFQILWQQLHPDWDGWSSPFVVVITFRPVFDNIARVPA